MDIPIKLKTYEKATIDYLSGNAPKVYQEKNSGFRWVSCITTRKLGIDWERINRIRIENGFSSGGFNDDGGLISHLTVDNRAYEKLRGDINQRLNMTRGVQKAFLVKTITRRSLEEMKSIARLTGYAHLVYEDERDLNNADTLEPCVDLFYDSGGDSNGAEIRERVGKLLMDYRKKMEGK